MKPTRIIFLGSKRVGYDCLQYLLEHKSSLGITLEGVLTNNNLRLDPKANIVRLCQIWNVPIIPNLSFFLSLPDTDIVLSVQYHEILRKEHITKAKQIAVNLHMAPLPEYRGCNQFTYAILDNAKVFGTTLHRLEEGIDSGAIISERRFPIPRKCFVEDLYKKTEKESILLFKHTIKSIINGRFTLTPQKKYRRKSSIHYRHEIEQLKEIDWNWSKEKIERYIRATTMPGFEGPFIKMHNKKIQCTIQL